MQNKDIKVPQIPTSISDETLINNADCKQIVFPAFAASIDNNHQNQQQWKLRPFINRERKLEEDPLYSLRRKSWGRIQLTQGCLHENGGFCEKIEQELSQFLLGAGAATLGPPLPLAVEAAWPPGKGNAKI